MANCAYEYGVRMSPTRSVGGSDSGVDNLSIRSLIKNVLLLEIRSLVRLQVYYFESLSQLLI